MTPANRRQGTDRRVPPEEQGWFSLTWNSSHLSQIFPVIALNGSLSLGVIGAHC